MLIRFVVDNWMSFREEASLSMIASSERQHSERIKKLSSYRTRILPIAAIYGGNASGKSNLIKAISFAQEFITVGPKSTGTTRVKSFRLDQKFENRPTHFCFEILIENLIYEYSFSLSSKKVIEEQLKLLRVTTEEVIFKRTASHLQLSDSFPEPNALRVIFEGTHDNQLYLTNSVSQKRSEFKKVFDWFSNVLTVVFPESHYSGLPHITSRRDSNFEKMTRLLGDLDSGIATLHHVDIPIERVPDSLISEVEEDPDDQAIYGIDLVGEGHVFVFKEGEKLRARKLTTIHKSKGGKNIDFSLDEESDGTRRLLDILPAFLLLEEVRFSKVFVVDELDRSLHSLLTRRLLDRYLSQFGTASRSQLIFTTHNLQLMDQSLFRRDEIWIAERDKNGGSSLTALSEYQDIRNDKNIRKSYLLGRMGGIPRFRSHVPTHRNDEVLS